MTRRGLITTALMVTLMAPAVAAASAVEPVIERVTTVVPFPRGLVMKDGTLYVLARGRVRDAGGVSAAVDDQAGAIYAVDPAIAEPISAVAVSDLVRTNGRVFAAPSSPPFRLWDRTASPPDKDRETDRPYCTLRWHEGTKSFYLCAFSGIDLAAAPGAPGAPSFSKNLSDALLRYDTRDGQWHEVERHDMRAGGNYPHHDPRNFPPPHGWLNGPDNCLVVGDTLYAAAKDNSLLVGYDLASMTDSPDTQYPQSEVIFNQSIWVEGLGQQEYYGQSALAAHDGWLYIGYRTSSVIVRIRLAADGTPAQPGVAQLLAKFDPYDATTGTSANITDMDVGEQGHVYVVSAMPARIYRFKPDPAHVYDAREGKAQPWVDLAARLGKPKLKSENVLVHGGHCYVTSGDAYSFQGGADGAVYRIRIDD